MVLALALQGQLLALGISRMATYPNHTSCDPHHARHGASTVSAAFDNDIDGNLFKLARFIFTVNTDGRAWRQQPSRLPAQPLGEKLSLGGRGAGRWRD